MVEDSRLTSRPRWLLTIAVAVLFGMTACEVLTHLLFPGLSSWQSTTITILFVSVTATLIALVVLREYERLHRRLASHIADERRTKEELRDAKETYQGIFQNSQAGLARTRVEDGSVIEANDKLMEIFGYESREEFFREWTSAGAYVESEVREEIIEGLKREGSVDNIEALGRRRDGSLIRVRFSSRLYPDKGYIDSVVLDVSREKEAEEALDEARETFRSMFLNSQVGMARTRISDGRFLEFNDRLMKMFGFDDREEFASGFSAVEAYADPAERERLFGLLERDGVVDSFITEARRRDGSRFWIEFFARVDREKGFIDTVSVDISERREAEEELKRSRQHLRNLAVHLQSVQEEERGRIARDIHDDLGQILTALDYDLALLAKRLPEGQEALLEKTADMSSLVGQAIKTVQRISSELRPALLDDLGLFAGIEWLVQEFEERTGIRCETTFDSEDVVLGKDLSTALFRAFQESLTNVARHAGATRVSVSLGCRDTDVILEVTDNGRGITEEELHSSKSLGLSGMMERFHPFGGRLDITGVKGRGTTVRVCIPLGQGV